MPKKVRRKRIASRGSVNNIILEALNEGDKYGYEIIKQVEEKTNGEIKLKQPSLYSSLGRLEQKGFISSYWGGSDIGGRRHYYYITKEGRHYYNTAILKLEVQESDEEIEALEKAAEQKRQEIMNECNTTKIVEEDNTVYGPKKESAPKDNILPVEEDDNKIDEEVQEDSYENSTNLAIEEISTTFENNNYIASEPTITDEMEDTSIQNNDTNNDAESKKFDYFLTSIKNSNHRFAENSKKLKTYNPTIPKQVKQVMVKDVDGIYKLRDETFDPIESMYHASTKQKVIDNVIIRRNINVVDIEPKKVETPTPQVKNIENMSQIEKEERNKKFASRFDEITNKILQEREKEKELEKEENYISKLDMLSSQYEDESNDYDFDEEETYIPRNVTLEEGEDPFGDDYMVDDADDDLIDDELSDDKFIDLDEEDNEIETTTTITPNVEQKPNIKGYKEFRASTSESINMNFVKINKARFLFGFVMMLLMISEVTITYLIIKSTGNYYEKDMLVYVIAYSVVAIISLAYILPYLLNQDKKALQTFKFKYSAIFGLLTFMILAILVYAFNSLAGFNMTNITYFASTIFVPLVLSSNFAIYSIIYNLILKIKSLY